MDKETWGFSQIWNKSLEERDEHKLVARDNLWASELGKSPIDIWLKLRATPLTNPPNARSLRKFEAGNVFEWIVSLILKRAGILKESQRWSSFQYSGLLKVTGKADFIAGGKVDIRMFEEEMARMELPNIFTKAGEKIVKYLAENYPDGLDEMPLEIKSVSSFMFEALEKKGVGSKIHRMQLFHYLKSEDRPKGNLVYICRDDMRMAEFPIFNPSPVEDEYRNAIDSISGYHLSDNKPPLERPIVFDDDIGKFTKNFNVAYSGYLTLLYGFKDQMTFDATYTPTVGRWNRVVTRLKAGDKITDKNNDVIKEITEAGFNIEDILKRSVSDEETKIEQ